MKKYLIVVMLSAGTVLMSQAPFDSAQGGPKEWIDAETGHRVVRLTDDSGGSTLYFHDNAFSSDGDTMMFNTPSGIAVIDVAKI
jgi:oligogalacturonide lyase